MFIIKFKNWNWPFNGKPEIESHTLVWHCGWLSEAAFDGQTFPGQVHDWKIFKGLCKGIKVDEQILSSI